MESELELSETFTFNCQSFWSKVFIWKILFIFAMLYDWIYIKLITEEGTVSIIESA